MLCKLASIQIKLKFCLETRRTRPFTQFKGNLKYNIYLFSWFTIATIILHFLKVFKLTTKTSTIYFQVHTALCSRPGTVWAAPSWPWKPWGSPWRRTGSPWPSWEKFRFSNNLKSSTIPTLSGTFTPKSYYFLMR